MSWGTNEKGINEMGDQWDVGPVSGSRGGLTKSEHVRFFYQSQQSNDDVHQVRVIWNDGRWKSVDVKSGEVSLYVEFTD